MTHAVCPGSFDPPTLGHLDVIGRAAGLFDRLTVAVLVNPDKKGLFALDERLDLLRATTARWPNVTSTRSTGCWSTTAPAAGIAAIVKGLRAVSDFDYELQMAQMNHGLTGRGHPVPADQPGLLVRVVVAGQAGRDATAATCDTCCPTWSPTRWPARSASRPTLTAPRACVAALIGARGPVG